MPAKAGIQDRSRNAKSCLERTRNARPTERTRATRRAELDARLRRNDMEGAERPARIPLRFFRDPRGAENHFAVMPAQAGIQDRRRNAQSCLEHTRNARANGCIHTTRRAEPDSRLRGNDVERTPESRSPGGAHSAQPGILKILIVFPYEIPLVMPPKSGAIIAPTFRQETRTAADSNSFSVTTRRRTTGPGGRCAGAPDIAIRDDIQR